jgi:uncharacterized protein
MDDLTNQDSTEFYSYDNTNPILQDNPLKLPSLMQVCLLYSITVTLFIFLGFRIQSADFYSGILITEFILVATPPIVLLLAYNYDLKKVLRLHKVSLLNLFIIFCTMVFAIPMVGAFNLINLLIIKSIFGKVSVPQLPIAEDPLGLLLNVLVIAGSAGICEELLFRGVIQRGFERFGIAKAILISSFLFGLMHVDFQRLLGTFLLGALIGFIVYRTNSLFSGMFAHFTNNALAVVLSFAATKLMKAVEKSGLQGLDKSSSSDLDFSAMLNLPTPQLIIVMIVYAIIFLFLAGCFIGLMIAFIHTTKDKVAPRALKKEVMPARPLIWLLPALVLVGILYFAEGLKMRGFGLDWVNGFLWLMGAR